MWFTRAGGEKLTHTSPSLAAAVIAILPALVGCASVTSGTSQQLTVATDPAGAACRLTVKDVAIGTVSPTPGSITVKRAGDSIRVLCSKDGYRDATYVNKPQLNPATLGNIMLGGVVGLAVDAASGANNKYEEAMTIRLEAASAGEPRPEPAAPEAAEPTAPPPATAGGHDRALPQIALVTPPAAPSIPGLDGRWMGDAPAEAACAPARMLFEVTGNRISGTTTGATGYNPSNTSYTLTVSGTIGPDGTGTFEWGDGRKGTIKFSGGRFEARVHDRCTMRTYAGGRTQ